MTTFEGNEITTQIELSPDVLRFATEIQKQLNSEKNRLARSSVFSNASVDEDEIKFRIGYKLKELRKDDELTLAEVSSMTGLSVSYLSDIERGRALPPLPTLILLTNFYRIKASGFIALCEL